jgi:hypothetical protein
VFRFAYDKEALVLIVSACGSVTDEAIDEYRAALTELDADATAAEASALTICIIEEGAARPNASQRQALADLWKPTRAPLHLFALVTTSALDRGILKVIGWLYPPGGKRRDSIHATFEEAAEWACRERGAPIPVLASLYARAVAARAPHE